MPRYRSDDEIDARHLNPKVEYGHPDFNEHVSDADAKRLDAEGREIVTGKAWGEAASGVWLTIFVTPFVDAGPIHACTHRKGGPGPFIHFVTATQRMAFNQPGWGAALELPSDLGDDPLKQQYVTEWFIDTVKTSYQDSGGDLADLIDKGPALAAAVEDCIKATGL